MHLHHMPIHCMSNLLRPLDGTCIAQTRTLPLPIYAGCRLLCDVPDSATCDRRPDIPYMPIGRKRVASNVGKYALTILLAIPCSAGIPIDIGYLLHNHSLGLPRTLIFNPVTAIIGPYTRPYFVSLSMSLPTLLSLPTPSFYTSSPKPQTEVP